ncbi:MAG: helix-turn-helix transcriptional regulator [Bacteroidales bacterium]|nr:helix-turn-helix transcriptional regulator [Bacteroidales bacterium]
MGATILSVFYQIQAARGLVREFFAAQNLVILFYLNRLTISDNLIIYCLGISHYSKIENGQREASVELLDNLAKFYGITIDQIVHMNTDMPKEISVEDKTASEQVRMIAELDEKDKSVIFSMIETMLTKKKFKDFFQKI